MASSMESIKKKMQSMVYERDNYNQLAEEADGQIKEFEEQIRTVSLLSYRHVKSFK
jgi:hypothetical protein